MSGSLSSLTSSPQPEMIWSTRRGVGGSERTSALSVLLLDRYEVIAQAIDVAPVLGDDRAADGTHLVNPVSIVAVAHVSGSGIHSASGVVRSGGTKPARRHTSRR